MLAGGDGDLPAAGLLIRPGPVDVRLQAAFAVHEIGELECRELRAAQPAGEPDQHPRVRVTTGCWLSGG